MDRPIFSDPQRYIELGEAIKYVNRLRSPKTLKKKCEEYHYLTLYHMLSGNIDFAQHWNHLFKIVYVRLIKSKAA